jgi:hypothetical protein
VPPRGPPRLAHAHTRIIFPSRTSERIISACCLFSFLALGVHPPPAADGTWVSQHSLSLSLSLLMTPPQSARLYRCAATTTAAVAAASLRTSKFNFPSDPSFSRHCAGGVTVVTYIHTYIHLLDLNSSPRERTTNKQTFRNLWIVTESDGQVEVIK